MKFISTRNGKVSVTGAEAVLGGIAPDGGLYVPESFPEVTTAELKALEDMSYPERAAFIIGKYLPEYEDLAASCEQAYARFDGDPAPLVKVDDNLYVLELWHGPTHAFKDVALTLLPHLMTGAKRILGDKTRTLILVATSGDTGKAALEGFRDVKGTDIIVLYPSGGVSNLQKLQMMTQRGDNVLVSAIEGNFDDAQTAVKKIFTDEKIKNELLSKGYNLSSANSINFGRLVPQITYYFSAYADLTGCGKIKMGDKVNFCVPSGNFGNILAAYYAKRMGLPVGRLICASNINNVLTDFFSSGEYNAVRAFHKTTSPSMDILVSSNLERLLFEICGRDDKLTAERMRRLKEGGKYTVTAKERAALSETFSAGYAGEEEVRDCLFNFFEEYGYVADPHTSVAIAVYDSYVSDTGDESPAVIVSTASPYKFVDDVLVALEEKPGKDEVKSLKKLEELTALPLPDSLAELPSLEKRFTGVVDKEAVPELILSYRTGEKD